MNLIDDLIEVTRRGTEDEWREGFTRILAAATRLEERSNRLTDAQLDELESAALAPHRQVTLPTLRVRWLVSEVRDLRDEVCLLQLKIDGSRAIVDAVTAAARESADTKLSAIQVARESGPPFALVDALVPGGRA